MAISAENIKERSGENRCLPTSFPTRQRATRSKPRRAVGAAAWIHAGGAHHTGFSLALTPEHLEDFAAMAGIEFLLIDHETKLREFKSELRWNEAAYMVGPALR